MYLSASSLVRSRCVIEASLSQVAVAICSHCGDLLCLFSFKSWWEVRPLSVSGSSPGHRKHQRQSCHGRSASRSLELSNNLNSFGEAFDIRRVTAAFHSGVTGPAWPDENSDSPWNDAKGPHLTNQTRNKRPTTNQSFSSSFIPFSHSCILSSSPPMLCWNSLAADADSAKLQAA